MGRNSKNETTGGRPPAPLLSGHVRFLLRLGIIAGIISGIVGFCGLFVLLGERDFHGALLTKA